MSSSKRARLFTLNEANALLPILAPLLQDLQRMLLELRHKHEEVENLSHQRIQGNGSRGQQVAAVEKASAEREQLIEQVQRAIQELEGFGCELKDISEGLLDFRTLREGQVVYLCWQLGEREIAHWHDLEAGFAGRQPLE